MREREKENEEGERMRLKERKRERERERARKRDRNKGKWRKYTIIYRICLLHPLRGTKCLYKAGQNVAQNLHQILTYLAVVRVRIPLNPDQGYILGKMRFQGRYANWLMGKK